MRNVELKGSEDDLPGLDLWSSFIEVSHPDGESTGETTTHDETPAKGR
jgi:hypothetical protein